MTRPWISPSPASHGPKRRPLRPALVALACAGLSACATLPPVQTAQVLLPGQAASAVQVQADLAQQNPASTAPSEAGELNSTTVSGEFRHACPWRGTDWGLAVDDGLGLFLDVKQSLGIPRDPQSGSAAVDAEIQGNPEGEWADGAALIYTQPLGPASLTLGSRFGEMQKAVVTAASDGGFGPTVLGDLRSGYVDLFSALELPVGRSSHVLFSATWRKLTQSVAPQIDALGGPYAAPTGWLALAMTWKFDQYLPYLGDHWAVPRRYVPGDTPDTATPQEHLAMAQRLRAQGLYQDAADEANACQREQGDPGEADRELAYDYLGLEEWDLAYFHLERAARAFPGDAELRALMRTVRPKMSLR